MGKNVKKKTAHNLYYGKDRNTQEIKHISAVSSGEKCNCNCVSCGTPLIARKGTEREHHFAHMSNNDCAYGNDIAIYLMANDVIRKLSKLYLPPITQRAPDGGEHLVKARSEISIKEVSYQCGPNQYPPEFFVTTYVSNKDHRLRILFDFDKYYSEEDLSNLEKEARGNEYSLLLYYFPSVGDRTFFKKENLEKIFSEKTDIDTYWIRSAEKDRKAEQSKNKPVDERNWREIVANDIYQKQFALHPNSLKTSRATTRRRRRF